ncbi:MAG: ComF family protein [Rubrivivax sp.]|nr:ComF family protein [Rubrivivax sp.]
MLDRLRAALPSQCEVCRGWNAALVCADCRARFAAGRPRCARCGLALGEREAACGACLREPPPFERTVCALDYGFPWDRLVAAFKFDRRAELAGPLAALLVHAVRRDPGSPPPDLVVPVPLTPARLAVRGFNQAWELARRVARALGHPARHDALLRVLDAPAQASLAREARRANLRNAFVPMPMAALAGRDVALVDDVMTTGATAHEAAAALRRGGARAVRLWVLARTPAPV